MANPITVQANGRLSLPADIRRRLGLTEGGALLIEELPDGVILRTIGQSIAKAQLLARKYTADKPESGVDGFLSRRRADSGE
jgi:AbrB family looped-hinge helix DNA binding protein